ncbi:YbhB/YbcL family Raf kinase inhibitor-like protein [Myxosarcina sp. GI1]|uniref:YbhB/YbcL family Raf kinase inhibitor-like protein n=1 Tax=Myxosarcina sp. GI1 TaxID=1541065 RepID=UPI00055CE744|nr:YbhB/YbcL family Raf kinase inhibitor-like protein [Myxosarcina sp. GI1]
MELKLKDLELTSPVFSPLAAIPKRYTSDGENISPPLQWSKIPPETKQLVLICYDPDAPLPLGFTHWTLYNIPPDITEIAEAGGDKFTQGSNSAGSNGYTGPAPPEGHGVHHYYFWLYALNKSLDLKASLNREELLDAIADYVTAQARLVGTYER